MRRSWAIYREEDGRPRTACRVYSGEVGYYMTDAYFFTVLGVGREKPFFKRVLFRITFLHLFFVNIALLPKAESGSIRYSDQGMELIPENM